MVSIGQTAFGGCPLTEIIIPNTVTYIGSSAFADDYYPSSTTLSHVYYERDQSAWNKITLDAWDTTTNNLPIYYYSETQPTEEGNFWHYVDGVHTVW